MPSYYQNPELYQRLLGSAGLLDDIYDSIQHEDLAEVPITALDILIATDTMPKIVRKKKSEKTSISHRDTGNKFYLLGKYWQALESYNKALLYSPEESEAMSLAYSNRSALLYKIKAYNACLNDIETCLEIGCTEEIYDKLSRRKRDCQQLMWRDNAQYVSFSDDFFKIEKRHPQIPCASTDIEVIIDPESELPKVVAAKNIKVGTTVAVETAFVNLLNPMNQFLSCYQCHKMSLNLIPCNRCCYALFCNEECKEICIKETHSVECHLMEVLNSDCFGPYSRITLRSAIKMKLMCDSWKEMIDASYNIGEKRAKNSPITEIYDREYKFSLLNFIETRDIKCASVYNFGMMCATLIYYLKKVPAFFPKAPVERNEAMRGMARLMMNFFLLFHNKVEINNVADDKMTQEIKHLVPNYGYLSFASKLRHDCNANLLPTGLNNKVALVALRPIKKGTELTISYINHAYDHMHMPEQTPKGRVLELYRFNILCRCEACTGSWRTITKPLNNEQRKYYRKWVTLASDVVSQGNTAFKATCDGLALLDGMSHTKEHLRMYVKFRMLMCVFQFLATRNCAPDSGRWSFLPTQYTSYRNYMIRTTVIMAVVTLSKYRELK